MIRSSSFRCAAPLLLLAAPSLLAGCAAGRSFSIAMANPGSYETVLVIGDTEADTALAAAQNSGARSGRPAGLTALLAGEAASIRVQSTSTSSPIASTEAIEVQQGRSGAPVRAGIPPVGATLTATVEPTTGAGVSATFPLATTQVVASLATGVSAAVTAPVVNAQVAASPITGANVAVTSPVAKAQLTASPAQGVALTATAPIVALGAEATPSGLAVQATAPAAVVQASLTTTASAAVRAVVPLVAVGANVEPSMGIQVAVASPATAALTSTSQSALRATLSGVGSAAALSAPVPGPHASVVQTLVTAVSKKPRHG